MARTKTKMEEPTSDANSAHLTPAQQTREMLESFAVAFILMLLMRNCLGENYQIPTGSMAPTLQGRHMDVLCEQCGYQYRTGASSENAEQGRMYREVTGTTCPICRYPMSLDKKANPNQNSFSGDRIIVSKLAYWLGDPKRWDVIVFKCPADAKVNYIKRLIGLPGETLIIRHGDILVVDPETAGGPREQWRWKIARKPPDKVLGMLQVVDDTRYIGSQLAQAGWPSRWIGVDGQWKQDSTGAEFAAEAGDREMWLRYRHLIPRPDDWFNVSRGVKPDVQGYDGMLITDYCAYNDDRPNVNYGTTEATNWVGDLAIECDVEVISDTGELLLDLVEGGTHFTCRMDMATGIATLEQRGQPVQFDGAAGGAATAPHAATALRGRGKYSLRFANVDDQLFLWVNGKVAAFESPTTYDPGPDVMPRWSPNDAGDIQPVGVGVRQATVHFSHLKVLRDVYYLAVTATDDSWQHADYPTSRFGREEIYEALSNPRSWATTEMFRARKSVTFALGPDEFFPLGDNSPASKDARLWSGFIEPPTTNLVNGKLDPPAAVDRSLMIGKAVFVYWPHAWYIPAIPIWPIVPNYQRIGFIH